MLKRLVNIESTIAKAKMMKNKEHFKYKKNMTQFKVPVFGLASKGKIDKELI